VKHPSVTFHLTPSREPRIRLFRPDRPHWGHVWHGVARHGIVTDRIVVYSPLSSHTDRTFALAASTYWKVAICVGFVLWLALVSFGAPTEPTLLLIAAATILPGIYFSYRGRAASRDAHAVKCTFFAGEETPAALDVAHRIQLQADELDHAEQDLIHGRITREEFDLVWLHAYEATAPRSPRK
jgi:hypothetical protein